MSGPLVGVVVPAFRAERFVLDAVRSVLEQSHEALELVVVDDGSDDRTAELVAAVTDPRLRLVRQDNAGVAVARNAGARLVGGDLLAFLDADDTWTRDKLARQLAALQEHPDWAAVGTYMHHVDARGRRLGVTGESVSAAERLRVASGELLPCPVSSVLFRRDVFESLGGFDEQLHEDVPAMVEDLDLMARLAERHPLGVLPVPLGGYRVHGASGSAVHFRNQRDGARFVRARLRRDGDLTWERFLQLQGRSAGRWRSDTAAFHYRACGVAVSEGRWLAASRHAAGAAALGPVYTARRLRLQRQRLTS